MSDLALLLAWLIGLVTFAIFGIAAVGFYFRK